MNTGITNKRSGTAQQSERRPVIVPLPKVDAASAGYEQTFTDDRFWITDHRSAERDAALDCHYARVGGGHAETECLAETRGFE
jgi:hypothetical protein